LIFANYWLCQWFTIINWSALNVPSFARGLWPQSKATGFAGGRLFKKQKAGIVSTGLLKTDGMRWVA